ncbi:MAG: hypothetical protein OMM_08510 [Candidatus Magnetoglobus multicellularis str. Araruama]|uniref:Uncharacterized protein n=1 Tax=Candidatus Magnetoglobus multicellularis str. Araruama TaxID=890399 RepID=A0A1V1P7I3_9BACT|nr:MAG: hypothetical protein OMM_08510 [Candidatus Magnetoglobus multicellularis str. Araruama]
MESSAESIRNVWAQIIPPNALACNNSGTITFPESQLKLEQEGVYVGEITDFSYDGLYTVIFYAQNQLNEISERIQKLVRVKMLPLEKNLTMIRVLI